MNTSLSSLAVIGAGAWGTALALAARRAGLNVTLQARELEVRDSIAATGENGPFLPGVKVDSQIRVVAEPAEAAEGADAVLLVTPAQYLRTVAADMSETLSLTTPLVICAKGIETKTGDLMTEVVAEAVPDATLAVLSGPTFAIEVARDQPTAVTLAAKDVDLAEGLAAALASPRFRIYHSDDPVGAEVGGAVKNVLAIACGIVEGRGLGDNARAALVTRGLAEIVRLGRAKGAKMETMMGLAGIGDLTLTANAMQSRNFSLGVALGQGRTLDDILGERRSVAEGVATAAAVTALAARLKIDMPICAASDAILNHGKDIDTTVTDLLSRPLTTEF